MVSALDSDSGPEVGSPQGPGPYPLPALRTPLVSYLCQDTGHTTGIRVRTEQPLYTREGFHWLVSRQKGSVDTSLVRPWVLPLAQLPWGIPRSSWEPQRRDGKCRDFVRAKPVRRGSGEAGGQREGGGGGRLTGTSSRRAVA